MLPLELTQRNQWICWRYEKKEGRDKPTKVPYNPVTGYPAKSTDATTWVDYETALQNMKKYDGIGFVFSKNDPYVGIDLDHVLDEKGNFKFDDAKELFEKCNSYTEISPSGTGIHILIKAKLSEKAAHRVEENPVLEMCEKEMYESGRYFTVTGKQLGNIDTINDGQAIAAEIEKKIADQQKFNKAEEITVHSANAEKDPLLIQVKKIFPEITESKKLVKKAAQIESFIEETQITKIKHGKEALLIEFTRNGCEEIAAIRNNGNNLPLPKDSQNLKKYAYQKLIRHVDDNNLWEQQKKPLIEDLGVTLRNSIKQIREKGIGVNSRVSEAISFPNQKAKADDWFDNKEMARSINQDLRMDLTKYPILSKYIQEWKIGEDGAKFGISVSGEIVNAIRFSGERTLTKEQTQKMTNSGEMSKGSVVANFATTDKTQETAEKERIKISDVFYSQDSEQYFDRKYNGACLDWLKKHGIDARSYSKDEFIPNAIYTNCNFSHFPVTDENIENITFKDCCFDHIIDKTSNCVSRFKGKNVEFDSCRFATSFVYEKILSSGATIKNCLFFNENKNRWEVTENKQPKQEKAPEIKKVAFRDI